MLILNFRHRARDEREKDKKLGLVPGMDPDDAPGMQAKAKSKNQKKNENKKKKSAGDDDDDDDDDEKPAVKPAGKPAVPENKASQPVENSTADPKDALSKKVIYL
jgi:hypothetical protein